MTSPKGAYARSKSCADGWHWDGGRICSDGPLALPWRRCECPCHARQRVPGVVRAVTSALVEDALHALRQARRSTVDKGDEVSS